MDIQAIRAEFPITRKYINLDNAGLSPFPSPVVRAVERLLAERSEIGVEAFWQWVEISDETKALIAGLINAHPDEIAFTQNTSEGINIVANMLELEPGNNVVLNNLEFAPNYWPWLRLRKLGVEIRMLEHRDGLITLDDFAEKVDRNTRVIALSSIAWTNGLKHNLEALGELAHSHGAYLVVDAIQSVGASQLDVRRGPVDFLACGGHKWLFGLLGSGFFYCRKELIDQFEPVYLGWQSDVERFNYTFREYTLAPSAQRFNHGNTSVAGHFAMHAGITLINRVGIANIEKRNRYLTDCLIAGLMPLGVRFLSPLAEEYRSAIVNFIPCDPQAVQARARERNILVCIRDGGIRTSPNFYNTEDEIDQLIQVVREVQG